MWICSLLAGWEPARVLYSYWVGNALDTKLEKCTKNSVPDGEWCVMQKTWLLATLGSLLQARSVTTLLPLTFSNFETSEDLSAITFPYPWDWRNRREADLRCSRKGQYDRQQNNTWERIPRQRPNGVHNKGSWESSPRWEFSWRVWKDQVGMSR